MKSCVQNSVKYSVKHLAPGVGSALRSRVEGLYLGRRHLALDRVLEERAGDRALRGVAGRPPWEPVRAPLDHDLRYHHRTPYLFWELVPEVRATREEGPRGPFWGGPAAVTFGPVKGYPPLPTQAPVPSGSQVTPG